MRSLGQRISSVETACAAADRSGAQNADTLLHGQIRNTLLRFSESQTNQTGRLFPAVPYATLRRKFLLQHCQRHSTIGLVTKTVHDAVTTHVVAITCAAAPGMACSCMIKVIGLPEACVNMYLFDLECQLVAGVLHVISMREAPQNQHGSERGHHDGSIQPGLWTLWP